MILMILGLDMGLLSLALNLRGGVTPSTILMGGHFYLWVFLGVMSVVFTVVKV